MDRIPIPDKMLHAIFEQGAIVAVTDAEGKYIYVNNKWVHDTNIPRELAIGTYQHDLMEGGDALRAMQTKHTVASQYFSYKKNGEELPGLVSYMPLFDGDKVIGCFISSSFLNVEQATRFVKRVETLREKNESLKKEMKMRTGARYIIDDIVGESLAIEKMKEKILMSGASNSTVLIEGETGSGKELVAHAIHSCSERSIHPFVKVNCSAIPENLMESEFFGYEEGAFTGAIRGGKKGKFERAHLGSLFLDEINHLSLEMQPKLLRVLQEKEFERVGGAEMIPSNTRIIAATNVSLRNLMKVGRFREDLFYRLNIVNIRIPPLRERREDIPLIVYNLIGRLNLQMGRDIEGVSDEAMEYLTGRDWPGNVRELQNSIERAMNASWEDILKLESFTPEEGKINVPESDQDDSSNKTAVDNMKDALQNVYAPTPIREPHSSFQSQQTKLKEKKEDLEKKAILAALSAAGNNKSKAARFLNISRTLLYQKLRKYDIGQ